MNLLGQFSLISVPLSLCRVPSHSNSFSGKLPIFLFLPNVLCGVSLFGNLLPFSAVHYFIYEAAIVVESVIRFSCFASIMAFTSCFGHSPIAFKIDHLAQTKIPCRTVGKGQKFPSPIRSHGAELVKRHVKRSRVNLSGDWSFIGGSRIFQKPKVATFVLSQKSSRVYASYRVPSCFLAFSAAVGVRGLTGLAGSQLASSVFTLGTAAVLPFYTLMVLAPKSELTKRSMQSSIPYVVLGILYSYLLYLSWTPETIRLIFASKYLLPELSSIGKMFSSEMTLASAWIHLLVVDLFAARHVFHDGLENQIETRHSVSLCLFFCPVGILTHVITKALTKTTRKGQHGL